MDAGSGETAEEADGREEEERVLGRGGGDGWRGRGCHFSMASSMNGPS